MSDKILSGNAFGFMCSFILALIAVVVLSAKNVFQFFIVLGQGHFLLAYVYQWRAGKIGSRYLSAYLSILAILIYATTIFREPQLWTFVVAGTIFAIHFFVDEVFINSLIITTQRYILGAAFVVMYGALLLRSAYEVDLPLTIGVVAGMCTIPMIVRSAASKKIEAIDMFFITSIGVLALMAFIPWAISLEAALGFIILFHYIRWYIHYLFRFQSSEDRTRFTTYIRDVLVVNLVIVGLFFSYRIYADMPVLEYLFEPTYFYIWTILHVLFSIRIPKGWSFFF
jgi:hypothetical protein